MDRKGALKKKLRGRKSCKVLKRTKKERRRQEHRKKTKAGGENRKIRNDKRRISGEETELGFRK